MIGQWNHVMTMDLTEILHQIGSSPYLSQISALFPHELESLLQFIVVFKVFIFFARGFLHAKLSHLSVKV